MTRPTLDELLTGGAEVAVSGRDVGRVRSVVDAISAAGGIAHAVTADLSGGYAEIREFAAAASRD